MVGLTFYAICIPNKPHMIENCYKNSYFIGIMGAGARISDSQRQLCFLLPLVYGYKTLHHRENPVVSLYVTLAQCNLVFLLLCDPSFQGNLYGWPFTSMGSASQIQIQPTEIGKYSEKKFRKAPKSKTRICWAGQLFT